MHDQKLGVWVAISRWRIVGPLLFEEPVNSKCYCSVLHDFIGLFEEHQITYSWFQQDGVTVQTASNAMKLMNEIFRDCVISGKVWPPCWPELTTPDFYLWGERKSHCLDIVDSVRFLRFINSHVVLAAALIVSSGYMWYQSQ
jgi:hypothetical protein